MVKEAPNDLLRAQWRRRQKQWHREQAQRQSTSPTPVYVCIDWGASYWRHYTSLLGSSPAQPSLVVYNSQTKDYVTGEAANHAWLPNTTQVRFENLKSLFDQESGFWEKETRRIGKLGLDITIDTVLERWWYDRLGPLLKRVGPHEPITFAIGHPAHFSPQSIQRLRDFFTKSREGRSFHVVLSEESTAALHGSRYSGFKSGDVVLVVDGGKSSIDCACVQITSDDPALTTTILKTDGLSFGGDYINNVARQHADTQIQAYKSSASRDLKELIAADSFERAIEAWWHDFEVKCKRDLELSRTSKLLDKIIFVPVPGLMETVREASHELAQKTKRLIEDMVALIQQMTSRMPSSILCLGGYCQSKELRALLLDMQPMPQFERGDPDGNDVINGLRNLALHPERAEWQSSPQHYLMTQDGASGSQEALLMCVQGEPLAKSHERVCLHFPEDEIRERKQRFSTPYHMRGHLIAMEVSVDANNLGPNEDITHEIEIRTADMLRVTRNKAGFQASALTDTTLLQRHNVTLPAHYRQLFQHSATLNMYVCITAKGQDIVLVALRPYDPFQTPDIEWMTLPEVLGTYGSESFELFKTSIQVTAAPRQGIIPRFDVLTAA